MNETSFILFLFLIGVEREVHSYFSNLKDKERSGIHSNRNVRRCILGKENE